MGKRYRVRPQRDGSAAFRYRTIREEITQLFQRVRSTIPTNDDFWALRDITLEVRRGEVLGLIGRNGAGKSTLLKLISRITPPSTGCIELRGEVASLLEVGTGFHPELTGRENVYLNGVILGMDRAEIRRRFDEIVQFANVERFIDTPVKRYSSGMHTRLAFSVAAHLDTEILLIDEVLAVGDADFRRRCLNRLSDTVDSERTVIFVSHNLAAIENLCHRVALVDGGRLVFDGSPREALHRYSELITPSLTTGQFDQKSRKGMGRFRFSQCHLEAHNGSSATGIEIGEPFSLKLDFVRESGWNPEKLNVGIRLHSEHGVPILTHNTRLTDFQFHEVPETGTMTWECPGLPLMPGHYRLELFAKSSEGVEDEIPHGFTLQIIESDFYESGRLPGKGFLLAHGSWNLHESHH